MALTALMAAGVLARLGDRQGVERSLVDGGVVAQFTRAMHPWEPVGAPHVDEVKDGKVNISVNATISPYQGYGICRTTVPWPPPFPIPKNMYYDHNGIECNIGWPKDIYMTYKDLSRVPQYVHAALRTYAPGYKVHWFNDEDCAKFMEEHASEGERKAYRMISDGAHRADLWRYVVLRDRGGVYLDADIKLLRPLDEVFPERDTAYTVINWTNDAIFQAIIVTPPNNRIFDELITEMILTVLAGLRFNYDAFTTQFYRILSKRTGGIHGPGRYKALDVSWELFKERNEGNRLACGGRMDKYGGCFNVYNSHGERMMGSRYPGYPY